MIAPPSTNELPPTAAAPARPRPWSRRPAVSLLTAAAVFAALTAIFFHPVLFQDKTLSAIAGHQSIQWPWAAQPTGFADSVQSDQANNVYPIQVDVNRAVRQGDFPYWSPFSFGGGPTLGTVYGIALYPPRLVMSLVLAPIQVHDLFLLLHIWLAGFATYLLLRRLHASWIAGILAGTAWMFSPSWFGLAILEGGAVVAALLPLSLWAMHRAVARRSLADAVLCGLLLALFVLGGSVQPAVFAFSIVCLWGLVLGVRASSLRTVPATAWANLRYVVIAGALGLLLSALVLVPGTAQISDSERAPVPYPTMEASDVGFDDLDNIVDPSVPEPLTGEGIWALTFAGIPLALLALLGLFSRRPGTGLARSTVVVFALLVIGTPLTRVAYEVFPGFAFLSPLGRLLPFMMFGVALLGAIGLDVLVDAIKTRVPRPSGPRVLAAVTAAAVVLVAVEAVQVMRYSAAINPDFQPRTTSDLFPRTGLIGAMYHSRSVQQREGSAQRIIPVRNGVPDGPFVPPPLVGEAHRLFAIENVGGYMNVMPPRSRVASLVLSGATPEEALKPAVGAYAAFFYASETRFDLLERFGVTDIVAAPQTVAPEKRLPAVERKLGTRELYDGPDGTLLSIPNAAPRAFVVDGVETASSEAEALNRYLEPEFPFRTTALIDGAGPEVQARPSQGSVDATVRVLPGRNDRRTIEVDSPKAGWLVLLESWDKGWSARVGGKDVPIERANFAYRAVPVPAGRSTVEMTYSTPGLNTGIVLSLLGVLVVLALLVVPPMRQRRVSRA